MSDTQKPPGYIIRDCCINCQHALAPYSHQVECQKHDQTVSVFGWCPDFEESRMEDFDPPAGQFDATLLAWIDTQNISGYMPPDYQESDT